MRAEFFDRHGRPLAEHGARDRNGLLRDGVIMRTHMLAKDSARRQRFADGRALFDSGTLVISDADCTGASGNRPGWRVADSPVNRQALHDARSAYLSDLRNAWRNPPTLQKDWLTVDARKECPNCDGTGEIDGEECPRCHGSGEIDNGDDDTDIDTASDNHGPPFGSQDHGMTVDAMQQRRDAAVAPAREAMISDVANAWRQGK
jgi:hypothetical protein